MLTCADCDLSYDVIYNNDGQGGAGNYCPRCGIEKLTYDDDQEIDNELCSG